MIGVFDSGSGGLTILKALAEQLPEQDYLYFGDHARAPYGGRSAEEIFRFTLEGVEELFRRGCPLVILACNTAAANALRRIQQDVLPTKYLGKRVLGVLVPTVEQITGIDWMKTTPDPSLPAGRQGLPVRRGEELVIGVLATEATVRSAAYTHEIQKRRPDIEVIEQACPELAPLIESGASEEVIRQTAKHYIDQLLAKHHQLPNYAIANFSVLLGCTHYELIAPMIAASLPGGVQLYQQSGIVAASLKSYLARQQNLVPGTKYQVPMPGLRFLTTGSAEAVSALAYNVFGSSIDFTHIDLVPYVRT